MCRGKHLLVLVTATLLLLQVGSKKTDTFTDDTDDVEQHFGSPTASTGPSHYDQFGHHDSEFDHEAVLGGHEEIEAFKELEPEEAKSRLAILFDKMDVSRDGFIDKLELQEWIISSFRNLDKESAKMQLDDKDKNRDGKLLWREFLEHSYGYTEEEFDELKKGDGLDSKDFIDSIEQEKIKFQIADVNKDGHLDLDEFAAFLHPHNYVHMAEIELNRTLRDFDKDKDGFINEKEFIASEKLDPETLKLEKEHFKQYDVNHDGKLDKEEIKSWIAPGFEKNAKSEVDHLFAETDSNKDEKLNKDEVVRQHDLWVGSHATDYGRHLETVKTEL